MDRPTTPNASPVAAIGDNVQSYDGPGVVVDVYEDHGFYGAPPMLAGEYVEGPWDGLAYVVETANGRTTFDRSRLRRV